MSEDPNVILVIWSHAHAPPLQPPADVSFDLRRVPNPPKHIRDSYNGRSKRLREHLLHDATFTSLLNSAREEILSVAKEREGGARDAASELAAQPEKTCFVAEGETVTSSPRDLSATGTGTSNRTASDDGDNQADEISDDDEEAQAQAQAASNTIEYDFNREEPASESGEIEPEETESESESRLLRIGCFCERGRHRSVAFAEELGRMAWPRAWDVVVQHRDVEGQGSGKRRSKRSWSGRKGGVKRGAFGIGPDGSEP